MSGLKQHFPEFLQAGGQVAPADIDQIQVLNLVHPSVDNNYLGTASGTTSKALTQVNQLLDYPRNLAYTTTGGTVGGTFIANLVDQFGKTQTETIAVGTSATGAAVYGTVIASKFLSGSINVINTNVGTFAVGVGTVAASNWFGLLTKIGGTGDVKNITWINNGTAVGLNKGTSIGSLVSVSQHAFQGTSGVAVTDNYRVLLKSSYDASSEGTISAL